ncbi:hypothetical protein [Amycolatopsis jiangsuensis]|uniref:Putative membrane-anchored protein n=1 Tax=Amycolatopsis jiangsuensis TaxID=1181879 RepID=A0A840IXX9_9PSEU|nr:hypothetical protein [Amycolatopsis jiangsuensis]MBB4687701.1 putative membrane-anchored protein [Amycolatopsis jiangsuensis]
METWRVVATVLLAVAGVPLAFVVMAKTRDHVNESGRVAVAGAVTATALLVVAVLTLTVLPGVATWCLVAVVAAAVGVMMLAS